MFVKCDEKLIAIESIDDLLKKMTPEVYASVKRAVELGKWPNGEKISPDQRQMCMQAVILWEENNLSPEQRSGYIPPKPHQYCGDKGGIADDDTQPLKFQ